MALPRTLTSTGPFFGAATVLDSVSGLRFLDCDPELFYNSLYFKTNNTQLWTRGDLHSLVKVRHRNILPANSGDGDWDDIYDAAVDLDSGTQDGLVQLFYRDVAVNITQQATVWEIERLWPNLDGTTPFTDVHNLRPVDVRVMAQKNASNYGMCGTVSAIDSCTIPATQLTGWDTAQDDKVWQPPQSKRGEIARALFYMDLRYEDLTLQDCNFEDGTLGYLSQLLEWHMEYPPTEAELERNNRACRRWQGNRNPFVDYPELAEIIFGSPKQLPNSSRAYPGCGDNKELQEEIIPVETDSPTIYNYDNPSLAPSSEPSPIPSTAPSRPEDPCASMKEGSLPFFLVNSEDPDEVVLLALDKIQEGWSSISRIRLGTGNLLLVVKCSTARLW